MARLMRYGELPLVVLACLSAGPRSSYQLMADVEGVFDRRYRPSTGTLYPAVAGLRQAGLIVSDDASRWLLTPEGWETLTARAEDLAAIEFRTGASLRVDDRLSRLLNDFCAKARGLADSVGERRLESVLTSALASLSDARRTGARHA